MANLDALLIAGAVAFIYIVLLRLVDRNEREPLWAMALFVTLGAAGGGAVHVFVRPEVLELSPVGGALARECAIVAAFLAGAAVLQAIGRLRGWDEINDVTDGVLYGAACGLGVALGELTLRELTAAPSFLDVLAPSRLRMIADAAAAGLTSGIFGACIGLGFGLAIDGRGIRRFAPAAGLVLAIAVHLAFDALARGNTLSGSGALIRAWIVLLLPIAVVTAAIVRSLRAERAAIVAELQHEARDGGVRPEDVALLIGGHGRLEACVRLLERGGARRCLTRWKLRNRLMMLALARRRRARLRPIADATALERQIASLRQSVRQISAQST